MAFSPTRHLSYLRFFHGYLGSGLAIAFLGNLLVALLDGIGLSLFIPLLSTVSDPEQLGDDGAAGLGRMAFVLDVFTWLGVPFTLLGVLLLMLVFFFLKGAIAFAYGVYRVRLQERFAGKIRRQNIELLAGYDYARFVGSDAGRAQGTFGVEINQLTTAYYQYAATLQHAAMALVYVLLATYANPGFAVLVAGLGILTNFLLRGVYRRTKIASRNMTGEMNRFQGLFVQGLANFKFLKATNLIDRYAERTYASARAAEGQYRRIGALNALAGALREPFLLAVVVLAIAVQVYYFGAVFGELLLSLLFLYRGLGSLLSTQTSYGTFLGLSGSVENMQGFVEELRSHQEPTNGEAFPGLQKTIALEGLSYGYGDDRGEVLRQLSLTIDRGATLGIVGPSGVGKTTLVNLIAGLLKPTAGEIKIDGRELATYAPTSYRSRIGYVTQEPPVFTGTVFENVSFWAADTPANRERVERALIAASARAFVAAVPNDLDELVGLDGLSLSGGQRQRLAVARELYREVDLLILDEATSALDAENTERVHRELLSNRQQTTIVIAHRLDTVRQVDQLLFLQPGGNYQLGTFEELRTSSVAFRAYVNHAAN